MKSLTPAQQELYDWLIQYISIKKHAPSIRQMMKAMNLKSPAPVQSRLERLRSKGYIDWTQGKARTIRILQPEAGGLRVLGAIAAGGLVEPFTELQERLDLTDIFEHYNCYALRVAGDSMVEDYIAEGDMVIMRTVAADEQIQDGKIVAARVEGQGTTLKRFYSKGDKITLQPSNPQYQPIEVNAKELEIQGVLVGVWRVYT
jgi:repressor LexA